MVNKEVIISVRSGLATVDKQPDGVNVHIRDYDIPLSSVSGDVDMFVDSDGNEYVFICDYCS